MSTLTAGGGVGARAPVGAADDEAAGAAVAPEEAADAEADAAATARAAFGWVCAPAASEYAAIGSAKVKTIVTRRRMRSFPFFRAMFAAPRGAPAADAL